MSETKICDYSCYVAGMKKSIKDKLFFEGLISNDVDTFVDFGCADGSMLAQVAVDFPDWNLVGIDNSPSMISMAVKNCPNAKLYPNIDIIKESETKHAILNISSVIHEIYSYCKPEEINRIWTYVFKLGFEYISVRDLMVNSAANTESDINDVRKVIASADKKLLNDFVDTWGPLTVKRNLLHFLMKYKYTENWDREVRENYFPLSVEQFLNICPKNYEIVYFNHYILPFNKDKIREDFGIELKDNTHIKILMKRIA